ncbi:serine/threonine-protein kinase [Luteimonas sp. RD2P54]|uniref:Serine/threonine-protein kinase n=1 Tax=Luteimonas endophytica TaxID=3042023 RepID=A0ABT6JCC9_9GAMM|nr:serine/threonine-protein kinase [Luteimonas endophytica]MDH5824419.1 serine/threonine-protein kinase [Luteimonas endophytica]
MDAERWKRVRALFDRLVELPREQWQRRLADTCAGDAALEQEVLALLAADAGIRAEPPRLAAEGIALLADLVWRDEAAELERLAGTRLGPFRLLHPIGHGGMGAVWLAERADGEFAQKVAIKLIRSVWDEAEAEARFRAERQILAGLQHPRIAHLIDGGVTPDGKPWLALEYVDGIDLGRYSERHRLDLKQRLQLFLSVCEAVAHAHARLVVHRDLKPSNILVSGDGSVKLLDFGIAKLVDAQFPQASTTRVFTPEYAAPEQVRGEPVTTAVDVYALGLLLYELLTGRHPYRPENATPAAYERAVLEQAPTRPSHAVTRDGAEGAAAALSAQRRLTPQRLKRELRGDLDAIMLKALRKEPAQRYGSVQDLAADLRAWLQHRPVAARRGGWRYGAARFLRRHALAIAAAATAVCGLAIGLGLALWQAHEARVQRDVARYEMRKSEQTLRFLTGLFDLADPHRNLGANVTARELLAQGKRQIDTELKDAPDARAALLGALGNAYLGLGLFDEAEPLLAENLRLRRAGGERDALVRALFDYGRALAEAGRMREDLALMREAAALLPDVAANAALLAEVEYRQATQLYNLSEHAESEALYRRALSRERSLYGHYKPQTVINFVTLLRVTERAREGERFTRAALALARERLPANDPAIASLLASLAQDLQAQGRHAEAEPLYREALELKRQVFGEEHQQTLVTLNGLGTVLDAADKPEQAIEVLTRVVALRRKQLGDGHKDIASPLNNLARVETKLGRYREARAHYQEAQRLVFRHYGREDMVAGIVADGLGRAQLGLGELEKAESDLRRAIAIFERVHGVESTRLPGPLLELARLQVERNRPEPDCASARRAIAILRKKGDGQHAYAEIVLGGCLLATGQGLQAARLIRSGDAGLRHSEPNNLHARSVAETYLARLTAHERR